MDLDDLDNIYNDLDDFQEDQNRKSRELVELELKYNDSLKVNEELRQENKDLSKKIKRIEINFQSLLDTAKVEMKRKDQLITQIRKEKDDICFRRRTTAARPRIDEMGRSFNAYQQIVEPSFTVSQFVPNPFHRQMLYTETQEQPVFSMPPLNSINASVKQPHSSTSRELSPASHQRPQHKSQERRLCREASFEDDYRKHYKRERSRDRKTNKRSAADLKRSTDPRRERESGTNKSDSRSDKGKERARSGSKERPGKYGKRDDKYQEKGNRHDGKDCKNGRHENNSSKRNDMSIKKSQEIAARTNETKKISQLSETEHKTDEYSTIANVQSALSTPKKVAMFDALFGRSPNNVEGGSAGSGGCGVSKLLTNVLHILHDSGVDTKTNAPTNGTINEKQPKRQPYRRASFDACFAQIETNPMSGTAMSRIPMPSKAITDGSHTDEVIDADDDTIDLDNKNVKANMAGMNDEKSVQQLQTKCKERIQILEDIRLLSVFELPVQTSSDNNVTEVENMKSDIGASDKSIAGSEDGIAGKAVAKMDVGGIGDVKATERIGKESADESRKEAVAAIISVGPEICAEKGENCRIDCVEKLEGDKCPALSEDLIEKNMLLEAIQTTASRQIDFFKEAGQNCAEATTAVDTALSPNHNEGVNNDVEAKTIQAPMTKAALPQTQQDSPAKDVPLALKIKPTKIKRKAQVKPKIHLKLGVMPKTAVIRKLTAQREELSAKLQLSSRSHVQPKNKLKTQLKPMHSAISVKPKVNIIINGQKLKNNSSGSSSIVSKAIVGNPDDEEWTSPLRPTKWKNRQKPIIRRILDSSSSDEEDDTLNRHHENSFQHHEMHNPTFGVGDQSSRGENLPAAKDLAAQLPASSMSPNDTKFIELDTRLQCMFQSPTNEFRSVDGVTTIFDTLQSTSSTSSNVDQPTDDDIQLTIAERIVDECVRPAATADTSAASERLCCNQLNSSSETKRLSLGSSEYRFEKVSENVIKLFITRKRGKRQKNLVAKPTNITTITTTMTTTDLQA